MEFKALKAKHDVFQGLESFPASPHIREVSFHSDELVSNCPITGQPDFNSLDITYTPDGFCVESKSLKLYLGTFRDQGFFGETLASEIAHRFMTAIKPKFLTVILHQHIRGGLQMDVKVFLKKEIQ